MNRRQDGARPYGALVHVGIDESPQGDFSSVVAQGVLPIFTPQAIDVAADDTPPEGQDIISERVAHVIWKARNAPFAPLVGFPPVIVVDRYDNDPHGAGVGRA